MGLPHTRRAEGMADSQADYRKWDGEAGTNELLRQQNDELAAQDQGLDALLGSVARQKQLGQSMGKELDEQNALLEKIDSHVTKTGTNINKETKRVMILNEKAKAGGIMLSLFVIVIIIVIIVVVVKQKKK
eukprot:c5247_g1_i1.p1 GENE.c5247_g1_i1~~c5247_g1_i1.p1  ORF type:complete len:131 (+),score=31.30 c5247_g1_i1:1-393(+)